MKLKTLAKKPELVKIVINDEAVVAKYGEPVEFWMYDRYEMETYMRLMNVEEKDFATMSNVVKGMIYDEDGSKIVSNGEILPSDILVKIVEAAIKQLGNSLTQTSEK